MIINDSMIWQGSEYKLIWHDCDDFKELKKQKLQQSYGVCFYKDKLVITKGPNGWSLVGGHIEEGESPEAALEREIQEETNMKALKQIPIGDQEVIKPNGNSDFQLRSFCKVLPIGKFENDPAGSVTEIKLIDPKDYKKYFDWGKIGEKMMERALELHSSQK